MFLKGTRYGDVPGASSLFAVARMAGPARRLRAQLAQLTALARTYALTGLPNRRVWDEAFQV